MHQPCQGEELFSTVMSDDSKNTVSLYPFTRHLNVTLYIGPLTELDTGHFSLDWFKSIIVGTLTVSISTFMLPPAVHLCHMN